MILPLPLLYIVSDLRWFIPMFFPMTGVEIILDFIMVGNFFEGTIGLAKESGQPQIIENVTTIWRFYQGYVLVTLFLPLFAFGNSIVQLYQILTSGGLIPFWFKMEVQKNVIGQLIFLKMILIVFIVVLLGTISKEFNSKKNREQKIKFTHL